MGNTDATPTAEDRIMDGLKIDSSRIKPEMMAECFQILDEALDVGIAIIDENLDYVYINRTAYKSMQLKPGQLSVGDPLSKAHTLMIENNVIDRDVLERKKISSAALQSSYDKGGTGSKDLLGFKNGTTHRLSRKHTKNGYTVSMNQDVTELVRKEEMLQKSLELGRSGYWIYDFRHKKVELSTSMSAIFSKPEIDLIYAKGILAVIHKGDRKIFKNALTKMGHAGDTIDFTCRNLAGDKWYRTTGSSERDQHGKLIRLRSFVKDITEETQQAHELERAKDEAISASIAKSEFLANMSHEIRTPMNGVLGMAELLAETNIDDRQREFIKVINQSSNALLTIINDILDFSKIEAGAFELDPMPFNFRTSLDDVASLLKIKVQEKNLELIIDYPPDMENLFVGDAGRLRQIITNLVGNAIKFTDTGHILIDVGVKKYSENRAELKIDITDTGIGIEPEKLGNIFEKFTQADNSTTRVYGGTGLGLSISKRIIELMGGHLSVSSVFGSGSTFSFTVPVPIDTSADRKPKDTTNLNGLRALIVDDIDINRNILSERLKSWRMTSVATKDSIDALTAIKQARDENRPFDVILLDYQMPGMNGEELAKMLSNMDSIPTTPIIMLSSCDQILSTSELQAIGIDVFLMKPVREIQLHRHLVQLMSEKKPVMPQTQDIESRALPATTCLLPNATVSKIRILVAEDFPLNQDVVRLMLEESDYEPIFANNGKLAVDMFQANPTNYAAILMDISMPVMDGYEAAERIHAFQAMEGQQLTPIIALTGHALKHDRDKCLEASMSDYLTKPVKREKLIHALDKWTQNPAAFARSA